MVKFSPPSLSITISAFIYVSYSTAVPLTLYKQQQQNYQCSFSSSSFPSLLSNAEQEDPRDDPALVT